MIQVIQLAAWSLSNIYTGERISWKHDLVRSAQAKFWAEMRQQRAKHIFGAGIIITEHEDTWAITFMMQ